jgi:hypothetical protein
MLPPLQSTLRETEPGDGLIRHVLNLAADSPRSRWSGIVEFQYHKSLVLPGSSKLAAWEAAATFDLSRIPQIYNAAPLEIAHWNTGTQNLSTA